jgi:hypothetical protein
MDLRNCNVPWKYISAAMNNKPVEDLKERWLSLRDGRSAETVAKLTEKLANYYYSSWRPWYNGKTERHVSFHDPLTTDGYVGTTVDKTLLPFILTRHFSRPTMAISPLDR